MSFQDARQNVLGQLDFTKFQNHSTAFIAQYGDEEAHLQWKLFCTHVKQLESHVSEKMELIKVAFRCLNHPTEQGELAQWITLYKHLKSTTGVRITHLLFKAEVPENQRMLSNYLRVFQLIVDLNEMPGIYKQIESTLPDLNALFELLLQLQTTHLSTKYPQRNIDEVIAGFLENDLIQFPLKAEELNAIKDDYLAIKHKMQTINALSEPKLQELLKHSAQRMRNEKSVDAKQAMVAILAKSIRSTYQILPYDTQIISLLALLATPEKMKGRIAQIKTGEGKSTIIAMLAAFMAAQGYFVDMVTSSGYLAKRDCKKYEPFFKALGLSASPISFPHPEQHHFHAQILYGTNTDFEFALLRDGLNNSKLRYSKRFDGELIERPFEVVIIDEVDNLFLDSALNSAQLGIRNHRNHSWIYEPVLHFVQSKPEASLVTPQLIRELRTHLTLHLLFNQPEDEQNRPHHFEDFSDKHLERLFESAHTALFEKQKDRDYLVGFRKDKSPNKETNGPEIIIVDYSCTGRTSEGCQWQHGVHQFLQLKHNLKLTSPTHIGASISHPAYFGLYTHILGLTGTMGEAIERQEIQTIYNVDSFDVPPHFKSLRASKIDVILPTQAAKWEALLNYAKYFKHKEMPYLILFKTIEESSAFSEYLTQNGLKNQLLNETQRESEDYIVAQAGEPGMITVATNTAGRGTDIILAPKSKEKGGLQMSFAFYPDNVRVQDQGFGRAGRQGQPGNCWMVLDAEDERIASLIKQRNPLSLLLLITLQNHLNLQTLSKEPISAKAVIQLLDELRTNQIQQESAQRAECSRLEKEYFGILQDFFTKMASVYTLTESETFKQTIITLCTKGDFQEYSPPLLDIQTPNWQSLIQIAILLIEKSQLGLTLDWSTFATQFKEAYIDHIRNLCASYYSKLKDTIEEKNRESAYNEVIPYLLEPQKMAEIVLGQLVTHALTIEKSDSDYEESTEEDSDTLPDNSKEDIDNDALNLSGYNSPTDYSEESDEEEDIRNSSFTDLVGLFSFTDYSDSSSDNDFSDLKTTDEEGWTKVAIAAGEGNIERIAKYAKKGADLNKANDDGWTPAHIAAQEGYEKVITTLAENGADLTIVNDTVNNFGAAYLASDQGHVKVLQELAKYKVNFNQETIYGATPLYIASQKVHVECIIELIKNQVDINKANHFGASPLFIAAQYNQIAAVQELIRLGADCTLGFPSTADKLRHFASTRGEDIISRMEGFINQQLAKGNEQILMFPYDIALVMGHKEIAQLLEPKHSIKNVTVSLATSPIFFSTAVNDKEQDMRTIHSENQHSFH